MIDFSDEAKDPIPQGWSNKKGPSIVQCALCGSKDPHPHRQSLWFMKDDLFVICTFRHVQYSFNVLAGNEKFEPKVEAMTREQYALFLIARGKGFFS